MPALTPTELLAFLREHEFLSPSQVQQFSGDGVTKYADSQSLARELIDEKLLTAYQANQLLQGKGGNLLLGPYLLVERLGAGGMGQVFKARHIKLDREVALKIIPKELVSNPTAVSRFYREARAVAKLSHPNIVTAFDINTVEQTQYLAMELVDGIDLAKLVLQSGPLEIPQACEYIRQAAIGLQHAHEHGLVHRDIKPGNLMVARSSSSKTLVVKILDFGLAQFESDRQRVTRLTQLGHVIGTVDYMAPEQAQNSRMVDIRADIYSLGCSLFYLLTGKPPFPGDSNVERLSARVLGKAPSVRKSRGEVSAVLDQVLAKMTARDPVERYQTPGGVAKSLAPFVKPSSKLDAKAVSAPGESISSPARGTKIHAETNEIKKVQGEVSGKPSPKDVQPKPEAPSPFDNLTDTSDASDRIVRVNEEAKPSRSAWWKRPGMLATAVGVSLALILTAVTANWVMERFAKRDTGEHSTSEEKPSTSEPQPAKAFVVLEIDQPGARVFIDKQIDPAIIPGSMKEFELELDPGTHMLRISKDGFEDYPQTVQLKPGAKLRIEIKLKPKPKVVPKPSTGPSEDSGNSARPTATVRRKEETDSLGTAPK